MTQSFKFGMIRVKELLYHISFFYLLLCGQFLDAVGFKKCKIHHGLEQRKGLLRMTSLTEEVALLDKDICSTKLGKRKIFTTFPLESSSSEHDTPAYEIRINAESSTSFTQHVLLNSRQGWMRDHAAVTHRTEGAQTLSVGSVDL